MHGVPAVDTEEPGRSFKAGSPQGTYTGLTKQFRGIPSGG